jgi:hypothetical protein
VIAIHFYFSLTLYESWGSASRQELFGIAKCAAAFLDWPRTTELLPDLAVICILLRRSAESL